jgi:hypothetical protein
MTWIAVASMAAVAALAAPAAPSIAASTPAVGHLGIVDYGETKLFYLDEQNRPAPLQLETHNLVVRARSNTALGTFQANLKELGPDKVESIPGQNSNLYAMLRWNPATSKGAPAGDLASRILSDVELSKKYDVAPVFLAESRLIFVESLTVVPKMSVSIDEVRHWIAQLATVRDESFDEAAMPLPTVQRRSDGAFTVSYDSSHFFIPGSRYHLVHLAGILDSESWVASAVPNRVYADRTVEVTFEVTPATGIMTHQHEPANFCGELTKAEAQVRLECIPHRTATLTILIREPDVITVEPDYLPTFGVTFKPLQEAGEGFVSFLHDDVRFAVHGEPRITDTVTAEGFRLVRKSVDFTHYQTGTWKVDGDIAYLQTANTAQSAHQTAAFIGRYRVSSILAGAEMTTPPLPLADLDWATAMDTILPTIVPVSPRAVPKPQYMLAAESLGVSPKALLSAVLGSAFLCIVVLVLSIIARVRGKLDELSQQDAVYVRLQENARSAPQDSRMLVRILLTALSEAGLLARNEMLYSGDAERRLGLVPFAEELDAVLGDLTLATEQGGFVEGANDRVSRLIDAIRRYSIAATANSQSRQAA